MTKNPSTDNDEIDLINVFRTLWEGKFFIVFFILMANLFVFAFINMKDPVYVSKLNVEIENVPPFFDTGDTGDKKSGFNKTFIEFTNQFYSKTNFDSWKNISKKSTLSFDNISKTDDISGYQFTNEDRSLAQLFQEPKKLHEADLVINTNNPSILNDFYNYSIYINKILEKEYFYRVNQQLINIKKEYKDFNNSNTMARRILKADEFVTNIRMGQNIIKVNLPSIPKKIGPKNSDIFGISSILGLIIGLLFVFVRKAYRGVNI